jgi:5-(carboxyamino)imidazole ribonucleotide mutase
VLPAFDMPLSENFVYFCPPKTTQTLTKSNTMQTKVIILMGSAADMPVMEKAALTLNDFGVHFEVHILSAHRTPEAVAALAAGAAQRGVEVIIAGAGMAAHLAGAVAAKTTLPVIGVPIGATLDGADALLSTVQMPQGVPVATVAINGAANAAILAVQILATHDERLQAELVKHKATLQQKALAAKEKVKEWKMPYLVRAENEP